ncbi:MAG: response regulator [Lachnospiraceae bacterium]|nr:response regulator [Lachnospiraceae bacterium]
MEDKTKWRLKKEGFILIFCIMINVTCKFVAARLSLPLWLDVIGTCVSAYFLGPLGVVITCVIGHLLYGIVSPLSMVYVGVNIIIGMFICFSIKKGYFDNIAKALFMSFGIGGFSGLITIPINYLLRDGKSGNMWGDAFYDMLTWKGFPKIIASISGEILIEIPDKQISVAIAFGIVLGLKKILAKQKNIREQQLRNLICITTVCCCVAVMGSYHLEKLYTNSRNSTNNESVVEKEESEENKEIKIEQTEEHETHSMESYVSTIYDSSNGMMSSEANDVKETEDGYIWIGGYAGLTRYDGTKFEFMKDSGIASVTALYTDKQGRLWIGTNDMGVARYEDGEFTYFGSQEGIRVASIRSFVEGDDGTVYVGTTGNIFKISQEDTITCIEEDITNVTSIVSYKEFIVGVDSRGFLFVLKDGKLVDKYEGGKSALIYSCIGVTKEGLMAGTREQKLVNFSIINGKLIEGDALLVDGLYNFSGVYKDRKDRIWLCAGNGIGCVSENGEISVKSYEGFDSTIESMHEDYEGNIWFTSTRYGVMKLSENNFKNIFQYADIDDSVVNAVCEYNGDYYCATDSGLVVIDKETNKPLEIENLNQLLKGVRIRGLLADNNGNLWICTYGPGLIRYDQRGEIRVFNQQNDNTTGDRFRCAAELQDGTIVAGSSEGLNFVKDDTVVGTIRREDGLENPQILSVVVDKTNTIYAASDGAGIYVIKGKKIVKHIGLQEGLTSNVVLRIVPYDTGYFLVTSNALCYMKDDKVEKLNHFPYYNNYDVLMIEDTMYVLASSGLYIANGKEVISGEKFGYNHYNYNDGLMAGITANSWNYVNGEGHLHFCTNKGVFCFDTKANLKDTTDYKMSVVSVTCDDKIINLVDGKYTVPKTGKTLKIEASLRNYTLANKKMCFYVEGLDAEKEIITQKELETRIINNLSKGEYRIVLQVLSSDEREIIREESYILKKEAHIWEYTWYNMYLIGVAVWVLTFMASSIIMYSNEKKRENEMFFLRQQAKDDFLAHMSHEIRTPVNAVIGMNELIMRESEDTKILEYADNIQHASNMLLGLINDILDFSALEAGKIAIHKDTYSLGIVIRDMVQLLEARAKAKGLEIKLEYDRELPSQLYGDALRLKQVITNLLTNAVKYTEKGSVTLSLKGLNEKEKGFSLSISVKDTGMGIREEDKERLFESFTRLEINKNYSVEGIGLGLNITKRLIDAMDGTMQVNSEYGKGTEFTVLLPQKVMDATPLGELNNVANEQEAERKKQQELFTAPKARILAVDDNEMNLKVLKGLLKETQIQLDMVQSGKLCIQRCKEQQYHLILMDHMMPEMDGIETLNYLKGHDNLNQNTPVIVLTANAIVGMRENYIKNGFSDYLSKPIDRVEMETVLMKYLPEELVVRVPKEVEVTKNEEKTKENFMEQIDKELGLSYYDNDMEMYQEILACYYEQAQGYVKDLPRYVEAKDWKNYAIVVHAIKSNSLGIGAKAFSELALSHEMESKKENGDFIEENFEAFMEKYHALLEEVNEMIHNV